jgi:hypothetical protein
LIITSLKEIIGVVIPHFDNYPLITKKYADYILFKKIVYCVKNKEHLTKEGLSKIVSLKSSMNLGLSEELKKDFSDITPALRPLTVDKETFSPD